MLAGSQSVQGVTSTLSCHRRHSAYEASQPVLRKTVAGPPLRLSLRSCAYTGHPPLKSKSLGPQNVTSMTGSRRGGQRRAVQWQCSASVDAVTAAPTTSPPPREGEEVRCRVVVVVGQGAKAPYHHPPDLNMPDPTWTEVMEHMAERLQWVSGSIRMSVFSDEILNDGTDFMSAAAAADMYIYVGVHQQPLVNFLLSNTFHIPTGIALCSASELEAHSRLLYQPTHSLIDRAAKLLPWSQAAKDARLFITAHELFERKTPNDLLYMMMVLINACITPVPEAVTKEADLQTVYCMLKNCRKEVVGCVTDPDCKEALDCLTDCGLNDQVCSYRCIVSHESPLFESFSLCNLQRHNCLRNSAVRPEYPVVRAMSSFRGAPLTHELAEQLFMGWGEGGSKAETLKPVDVTGGSADWAPLEWSWKVVCGQNPAYDHFPCQHQIFYQGAGKGAFWYDPVFQVKTLSGEEVWRRRHYRVKRTKTAGEFMFSVLDNGVTSLEYWRIVDVAEDLSWACFYYTGAATAAGQAYSGAVFCTPDGQWPAADQLPRVQAAHDRCGIKLWELYQVDNSACEGAPLGLLE